MVVEPKLHVGDATSRGVQAGVSGLRGFGQEQLVQVQRARILAGAMQVVDERGASGVVIGEIVQRAGVSRRTFYELFADRDECLVAAFDDALSIVAARVLPALDAQRTWLARLRAGVAALMGFLDEQPQLGRLLVCDSLAGGPRQSEWRAKVVARLVAFVDEGRGQGARVDEGRGQGAQDARQVPVMQADGSVGGALAVLQSLLSSGKPVSFAEHSGSLVAMIALPYVGQAAARRELERPVPASESSDSPSAYLMPELPFKAAGMRLTYRTMRVLVAIAECPGASNREIGELAEISDQGQMSKLLRRLQRAELISNDGAAPGQGAPNVWRLSDAGEQLAGSIRAYSEIPDADKSNGGATKAVRSARTVRRADRSHHNSRRGK